MANTEGRDVVGRLRQVRDAALAGESYWVGGDLMPVRISEFEALLAVVEAAKELLQKHGVRPAPTIGLSADLVSLNVAIARLYDGSSEDG